jgi:hypothetical protein
MPQIKNAELYFCKLNRKRPNDKFNKENPTWECQIRTSDKEVKKVWEAMGLSVKAIVPDDGPTYFRVNLRKKSIKKDGSPASPVKCVNGKLDEVDPDTIGNGSIGNVRVFQYPFEKNGKKQLVSVLMGVQLVKHILYKPKAMDDEFEETESEVTDPDPSPDAGADDGTY